MVSKKATLIAIDSSICDNLRLLLGMGWSSKNFFTYGFPTLSKGIPGGRKRGGWGNERKRYG